MTFSGPLYRLCSTCSNGSFITFRLFHTVKEIHFISCRSFNEIIDGFQENVKFKRFLKTGDFSFSRLLLW